MCTSKGVGGCKYLRHKGLQPYGDTHARMHELKQKNRPIQGNFENE